MDKTELKTPGVPVLGETLFLQVASRSPSRKKTGGGKRYGRQGKKRRKGWQEGRQKKHEGKKLMGIKINLLLVLKTVLKF